MPDEEKRDLEEYRLGADAFKDWDDAVSYLFDEGTYALIHLKFDKKLKKDIEYLMQGRGVSFAEFVRRGCSAYMSAYLRFADPHYLGLNRKMARQKNVEHLDTVEVGMPVFLMESLPITSIM